MQLYSQWDFDETDVIEHIVFATTIMASVTHPRARYTLEA
jgi:hypothetical protein